MSIAAPLRLEVRTESRTYPILIGRGLIDRTDSWTDLPASAQALIVSNTTVAPLYAARLQRVLAAAERPPAPARRRAARS